MAIITPTSALVKLKPAPPRGGRLNDWMFGTAATLARRRVPMAEAHDYIAAQAGQAARPGEVSHQVNDGYRLAFANATRRSPAGTFTPPAPRPPAWPARDDNAIREVVAACPAILSDIYDASPYQPDHRAHPLDILATLHGAAGPELLCMAPHPTGGFQTKTIAEWTSFVRRRWRAANDSVDEILTWEMVVPNLMRAPTGTTLAGKPDRARTAANACNKDSMQFVVVEVDIPTDDPLCKSLDRSPWEICASVILSRLPADKLRMVVMSGGKSLHAWLDVAGQSHADICQMFRALTPLAVDPAGRLPAQQFRLPNGYRADKQARQSVIYWNPK